MLPSLALAPVDHFSAVIETPESWDGSNQRPTLYFCLNATVSNVFVCRSLSSSFVNVELGFTNEMLMGNRWPARGQFHEAYL